MRNHVLPIVTRADADWENQRWLRSHAVSVEGGAVPVRGQRRPSAPRPGLPSIELVA